MRHLASSLALAALVAASGPASAAFHLFRINEVYTNNNGTVQFVELTALAGGQQFTSGHTLTITPAGGGAAVVCNSAPNLPGDTSGKKMLFGTAGVQARFGVTPDYICPNSFVAPAGGTINWGEGSDTLVYPALPVDGATSLNTSGVTFVSRAATPQSFAGLPPAYQGMWWQDPGQESGWGINTAHQGDIIFATWFTYGADGKGLWMILSNASKIGEGQYRGDIYTARGPPFNAEPFFPNQVVLTNVGNGTFTFGNSSSGTFQYTVNDITQTKDITRFVFSAGAPECTLGGTPTGLNYQDIWWKAPASSESGWGLNIVHQGNRLLMSWFTYDATGKGQWLLMPDVVKGTGESFSGKIYRYTGNPFNSTPWNPASVISTEVGTATVVFSDRNNGTFAYTLDNISQSKAITRTVFNPDGAQAACNAP
ncbi:hypothetical protein DSM104443_02450 [Usitatibacter rugosus]|uniref:Uncharacterized protein n=1 Tax=Usitatibacter rugosus TaxID=2732067 RepID=A0A6M4GWJ6_9PROT|nr:hypothetical protein [Usitatibacter rugosus]QJR11375.1 hypothetical protein DSM104443_02450 [Usitatibacter rugosus]